MNALSPQFRDRLTQGVALLLLVTVCVGAFFGVGVRRVDPRVTPLRGPYQAWLGARDAQGEWRWTEAGLRALPLQFAAEGFSDEAILRLDVPVELPPDEGPSSLLIRRLMNSVEIRWDGELVHTAGSVWDDARQASRLSLAVPLPRHRAAPEEPGSDHVLTLYLRARDGVGGVAGELLLGPIDAIDELETRDIAQRVFLGALLLTTALAMLTMTALRPGERAYFWFGLFCAAAAMRLAVSSVTWVPIGLTPLTALRLSYALTGVIMAAGLLFSAFYVGQPRTAAGRLLGWACWALALASLVVPDGLVADALPVAFKALSPLVGGFAVALMVMGWRQRVYGAEALALSALLLVVAGVTNTLLGRLGWDYSGGTAMGYVVFTITASTALVLRSIDAQRVYQQLVADAPDPILLIDAGLRVLEANEAARRLMPGLADSANLLGSVIYEDQAMLAGHLQHPDRRQRVELRVLGEGGELRWVESLATPLEEGRRLVVLRETTHRRSVERGLVHAARLETAGLLASGIAHDVNNALAALMGHLELLRESGDDKIRRRAERMDTVIRRAAAMTRRLLKAVRGGGGVQSSIDPSQPARDAVELVASMLPAHIQVTLELSPEVDRIRAVAEEIEQALLNLLLNARDAMSETGGVIRLRIEPVDTARGPGVRYAVDDQGPGVPPHLWTRIWEPFFTTKGEGRGTGLGLSVVARVAREHGGSVQVFDAPGGRGARFVLDLPADGSALTQSGVFVRTGLRVLVVDDDADVREMMCAELRARGSEVIAASSGEEALASARLHPELDLLVTDVMMPGISGVRLAEQLLTQRPDLPVLVVSGFIPDSEPELRPDWGRLNKPFSAQEFSTAVRRTMMRAGRSRV